MIKNLLNSRFVKGSKVLGVDMFVKPDGTFDINGIVLNLIKNNVAVEKKYYDLQKIIDLNSPQFKGLPVFLSIDGKGVLFKKVERVEQKSLLQHILPNAKEDDFYVQSIEAGNNEQFISAIRKEVLDKILDTLSGFHMYLTSVYIGPLAIKNLIGLIEHENFFTNRYHVKKTAENNLSELIRLNQQKTVNYTIGDDEISNSELIAYSTAIGFFIDFDFDKNPEKVKESKRDFIYKRLFILSGWITLAFFFTFLLVNYLFYSKYDKKINTLRYSYNQNKELIKKLDTLKSELKLKEQYFINSGFLDASKLSYYADRIAYTVPKDIVLTQLNINPLEGKIKDNKPISFQNRKILILGTVTQSIILNNWVKQLKDTDWIKNVKIIHYNQESVDIPAEFELLIDL